MVVDSWYSKVSRPPGLPKRSPGSPFPDSSFDVLAEALGLDAEEGRQAARDAGFILTPAGWVRRQN